MAACSYSAAAATHFTTYAVQGVARTDVSPASNHARCTVHNRTTGPCTARWLGYLSVLAVGPVAGLFSCLQAAVWLVLRLSQQLLKAGYLILDCGAPALLEAHQGVKIPVLAWLGPLGRVPILVIGLECLLDVLQARNLVADLSVAAMEATLLQCLCVLVGVKLVVVDLQQPGGVLQVGQEAVVQHTIVVTHLVVVAVAQLVPSLNILASNDLHVVLVIKCTGGVPADALVVLHIEDGDHHQALAHLNRHVACGRNGAGVLQILVSDLDVANHLLHRDLKLPVDLSLQCGCQVVLGDVHHALPVL
mmetsp:Transcript_2482/g.6394  ORF Transcript_2482/g.6394 Transcript_2482/m.6394 type:complete len:305 (-) Transcript_2482:425-1339(-)